MSRSCGLSLCALPLAVLLSSCSPDTVYVTVDLSGIPSAARWIIPVAVVDSAVKQAKPYSLPLPAAAGPGGDKTFSISLPARTTGTLYLGIAAIDDNQCLLARGSATQTLTDSGSAVQVPLSAVSPVACPTEQAKMLMKQEQIVPYVTVIIEETTQITIFGFGFLPGITATINGRSVSVVWKSPTEITLTLSSLPPDGMPTLTVQNPGQPPVTAPAGLCTAPKSLIVDNANKRTRRFGSSKNDRGGAVAMGAGGDVFLAGYFSDTLNFDGQHDLMPVPPPNPDASLVGRFGGDTGTLKLPPLVTGTGAGAYVAENSQGFKFDPKDNPGPYLSLAVDKDGALIVAGAYHGALTGFHCPTGGGSSDGYSVFVAKFQGDDLSCKWLRVLGAGRESVLVRSIAVNSSKSVLVAGEFSSTLGFHGKTYTANSNWRAFVATYSDMGDEGMLYDFGTDTETFATVVAVDGSDNVYLAGRFSGTTLIVGDKPIQNAGGADTYVIKLDAKLNAVWARSYGGSGNEVVGSLAVSRSGKLALTGSTDHAISWKTRDEKTIATTSVKGTSDGFVALLNDGGDPLWARAIGASDSGAGRVVAFDGDEDVLLAGVWAGTIDAEKVTSGNQDFFLARHAADGSAQRHLFLPFGGPGDEDIFGMALQPCGALTLTGYSNSSTWKIGTASLDPYGQDDILVVRLAPGP